MKLSVFTILVAALVLTASSCENKKPAKTIEGTYTGAFNGDFEDSTYLASEGYPVKLTALTKNTLKIEGLGFSTYEFLVTWDGLNVTRVNVSDTNLTKFTWIQDEERVVFDLYRGDNWCTFNGTR